MMNLLNKRKVKHFSMSVHSKNFLKMPFVAKKIDKIIQEKNIDIVYRSTGKAIFVTSATIMFGMGSFWLANHRGFGEVGITIFIGVAIYYLISVLIIPAMIGLIED